MNVIHTSFQSKDNKCYFVFQSKDNYDIYVN